MKIIIVGNGKVGFSLAQQLVNEKHDVTIVDIQETPLSRASETLDLMVVQGNGISASALTEAGAQDADILVATTNSDEINMVCCLTAKSLGTGFTIARIRNPEYTTNLQELRQNLKIDMVINPENATAIEIARLLRFPSAANIETFCRGRVELMGFRLQEGDVLVGSPLYALSSEIKRLSLLFCAADRNGDVSIPNGAFVPQTGDKLYIIGRPDSLDKFFHLLGRHTSQVKKVFLIGGGKIANYLLPLLSQLNMQVKVVDRDLTHCRRLSEQFPKMLVIHGDGLEQEVLEAESLPNYDAFVALTNRDEDNLIISLYAMQQKLSKVITKCNRHNYAGIARSVGLDSIVSPKFITASTILHLVRGMQNSQNSVMLSLHRIADGAADAMEFAVASDTWHLETPLKDLHLKRDILISVIVRGQQIIIPEGSSYLKEGDQVIIIARSGLVRTLNDIFDHSPSRENGGNP